MIGAPRSKEFGDVYFSAENGLEETRHVFLNANGLPGRWAGRRDFTIAETGFGTGLNFLAAAALFLATAEKNQKLHFISFEKFPLHASDIRRALEPWMNEIFDVEKFLAHYPEGAAPGRHDLQIDLAILLTLIIGDVNETIPALQAQVDCWFLDGFRPASNPDMWSETLFGNMGRLSAPGASFATFTAAGFVKRGLQHVGFTVSKQRGFGRKRDMLAGHFP